MQGLVNRGLVNRGLVNRGHVPRQSAGARPGFIALYLEK